MREEAEKRIGHLYPKVEITSEMVRERPDLKAYEGRRLTVIAWLWARTVKSPNPAFADVEVPLASTFMLSTKRGKEAYVEPVIEGRGYRFTPRQLVALTTFSDLVGEAMERACRDHMAARAPGQHQTGDPARRGHPHSENSHFEDSPIRDGDDGVAASSSRWQTGEQAQRESEMLVAANDTKPLRDGGTGARAYAEAVGVYLAFALSKLADQGSTICTWFTERDSTRNTFSRQSIPMKWDCAELNILLTGTGSFLGAAEWTAESIDGCAAGYGSSFGVGIQADAGIQELSSDRVVSTDPPYYDNIGYAESISWHDEATSTRARSTDFCNSDDPMNR